MPVYFCVFNVFFRLFYQINLYSDYQGIVIAEILDNTQMYEKEVCCQIMIMH